MEILGTIKQKTSKNRAQGTMLKAVPPFQLLPDFMKFCSYLTTYASLKPAAKSFVIFSVKNKHFTVGKVLFSYLAEREKQTWNWTVYWS